MSRLAKVEKAMKARTVDHEGRLRHVIETLEQMRTKLGSELGKDADTPVATLGKHVRADAFRAAAAARWTQAWLDASANGCRPDEVDAMLAALSSTVDALAADDAAAKAPLPLVEGMASLEDKPVFVLRGNAAAPKFVLTGRNLVDPSCADPKVQAQDADGKPAASQPRVIAAQATRVELRWPGMADLAPGTYVLHLSAKRKAFLFGCVSQPETMASVGVAGPGAVRVSYTVHAQCGDAGQSVRLDAGTLPALGNGRSRVAHTVDVSACKQEPTRYSIEGTVAGADGTTTRFGPVTHSADAGITTGLGHGVVLDWDPSVHLLVLRSTGPTCSGVL